MGDLAMGIMQALGYLGLGLVLVIENLFPPIPSEVVLPLAGFLVGTGRMNFWGAVAAATAGAYVGAMILYTLGRWGGRPLILRYGRVLRIDEKGLECADGWFKRYSDWVVLFARVVPLARSVVSVPAGTMRMPVLRFSALTLLGSAVWNVALIQAGALLGENWETVSRWAGTYSDAVVVILGITVFACCAHAILRHKAARRGG